MWSFHPGDLAGLFHIAVGKQFEYGISRSGAQTFGEMLDNMTDNRRDQVIGMIFAHETDRFPMVCAELEVFLKRKQSGHLFVPVLRNEEVASFV